MSLDTTIGIVSLLLALYSLAQSKLASKIAKEAKEEVRKNRNTSELSKLSGRLDIVIQEVKIFGPITSSEKLRGIDHHKIAENIQDFTLMLKDCYGHFKTTDRSRAKAVCETVTNLLEAFGDEAKSLDDVKSTGRKILNELSNFSSELKATLNKRIEKD